MENDDSLRPERYNDFDVAHYFVSPRPSSPEIGAPTPHAAIVARELGLPAVVNVNRVTERVRTGETLFVNGWAGLVHHVHEGP